MCAVFSSLGGKERAREPFNVNKWTSKTMLNFKLKREDLEQVRETDSGRNNINLLACNNILSEALPLFLFKHRLSATTNLLIKREQIYL